MHYRYCELKNSFLFTKSSLDSEIFSSDNVSDKSELAEGSICDLLADPVLARHHQVGRRAALGGLGQAEEPFDCGELGPVDPRGGEEDLAELLVEGHGGVQ